MKTKCGSSSDTALFRRLLAAGCPMPLQIDHESSSDLSIEITKPELTVAYDRRAGSEFVFSLRVTNHSYSRLVVQEFRAEVPWQRRLFLFADPKPYSPKMKVYRLESGCTFRSDAVLNHRVHEYGELGPGERMEGVLLGLQISCRIPFDYLHGTLVPGAISLIDQFGRTHESGIEIRVDRSATMPPLNRRSPRMSLFADAEAPPVDIHQSQSVAPIRSARSGAGKRGHPETDHHDFVTPRTRDNFSTVFAKQSH